MADVLASLQRWRDSGAVWRVVTRSRESVTVALFTCDGGDEVDRLTSSDPAVLDFLAGRDTSDG
jgi:hypothetical protein